MKHLGAFVLKFSMTLIVLAFFLGYSSGWFYSEVLVLSLIITLVGYAVGDLWILRRGGNLMASSADFALIFIFIWGIGLLFKEQVYEIALLFSALILAVGEWFFHLYIMSRVTRIQSETHA